MTDHEALIGRLWDALNRQDLAAALACLHADVDWQDIMNTGRLQGRGAVLAYWGEVFKTMRPDSAVIEFRTLDDGRLSARTLHNVSDAAGLFRVEEIVTHVFSFRDGLIVRMDAA